MQIAKTYDVAGYPTFILANSEGSTLERWWGYGGVDDFIPTFDGAMQDPTTIEEKRARYEASPNIADAMKLAMYHETRDEYKEAVQYYRKAQDLGAAQDVTLPIFEVVASGARDDVFTLAQVREAADAALAAEGREVIDVVRVARMMTSLGRSKDDHEIMVPYLKKAMQASEGVDDEDVVRYRKRMRVDHALFVERDADQAVAYRKELLDDGWMQDAEELNAFAWWCFENRLNLEEAETLARRGVELAENRVTKAMILDTVAEICNARGSCKDAVLYIELAIEADPDNSYYEKQLERFQKLLAEQD